VRYAKLGVKNHHHENSSTPLQFFAAQFFPLQDPFGHIAINTIMKTTLLTVLIVCTLSLPTLSLAQPKDQVSCKQLGELAYILMQLRQKGGSISRSMEIADGNTLIESMVISAYELPRYSSLEYQQKAAEDFRNIYEAACYSAQRKSR
jgi:hypothetical protein